ncbi:MAG: 50S ribosomal protein L23 [Chlamydiae bacterium]|nr:50S ribosomal protein L23 [Chlamydiota bacterium]
MEKNPYNIIKKRLITEKANVLSGLCHAKSNACVRKFDKPKYVFIVDNRANKQEIAWAIEKIYENKKIKVTAVNTITIPAKARRVRGFLGMKKSIKKAVVTLSANDSIEEQV